MPEELMVGLGDGVESQEQESLKQSEAHLISVELNVGSYREGALQFEVIFQGDDDTLDRLIVFSKFILDVAHLPLNLSHHTVTRPSLFELDNQQCFSVFADGQDVNGLCLVVRRLTRRSIKVSVRVSVKRSATIEFNAHLHLVASQSEWEYLVVDCP